MVTRDFADNDRAQAEGDTRGLGKLITPRGGAILGVGLVGRNAGELLQPWVLALSAGAGVNPQVACLTTGDMEI